MQGSIFATEVLLVSTSKLDYIFKSFEQIDEVLRAISFFVQKYLANSPYSERVIFLLFILIF